MNNIKKLIKEYVKEFDDEIEEGKKLKEKYNNEDIRISTNYINNYQFVEYYYYNPVTEKVTECASFLSNGSNFSYRNIGDIELVVITDIEDNKSIQINRIINTFDEDMAYSDDFEKKKFEDVEYDEILEKEQIRDEYYCDADYIVSCINCGKEYLVSQEGVENGEYTELNEDETKIICSECTENQSINDFLKTIEDNDEREKYEEYLLNYIGLDGDNDLFL